MQQPGTRGSCRMDAIEQREAGGHIGQGASVAGVLRILPHRNVGDIVEYLFLQRSAYTRLGGCIPSVKPQLIELLQTGRLGPADLTRVAAQPGIATRREVVGPVDQCAEHVPPTVIRRLPCRSRRSAVCLARAGSHAAMGWVQFWRHEPDIAIDCYRRAQELNPSFADGHYGHVLSVAGLPEEGHQAHQIARPVPSADAVGLVGSLSSVAGSARQGAGLSAEMHNACSRLATGSCLACRRVYRIGLGRRGTRRGRRSVADRSALQRVGVAAHALLPRRPPRRDDQTQVASRRVAGRYALMPASAPLYSTIRRQRRDRATGSARPRQPPMRMPVPPQQTSPTATR